MEAKVTERDNLKGKCHEAGFVDAHQTKSGNLETGFEQQPNASG